MFSEEYYLSDIFSPLLHYIRKHIMLACHTDDVTFGPSVKVESSGYKHTFFFLKLKLSVIKEHLVQ